ncbi:NADPH-dependent assimilatory sulfite reductase hemoprotein subunit [Prochlorococcus sp. MIT 1307]|uniref:NADPH-dependent assimilatory sulfite reductase hemoprotein subunit n=1 Tax=Prochlorococcus sp. MIT 1307 TaxID=3096219 RepID=UPI002A753E00|nr:NADPH-dependent assimilatory sulfite reductase hemoprotein subunit [Prochlorococcus sp. MIT 1307]
MTVRLATLKEEKNCAVIQGDKESDQTADKSLFPCIANKSELTKFERFKAESKYLREPLETELENESDHFSNDALQLLKFHGSYQQDNRENRKKGSSKDWQMMLRLRSPGGKIPPSLFFALDQLSDQLGNGTLRATTRQAFQMHGVKKENLRKVIRTIIKSLGSTLAACGDINRNVMAPAAPYEYGGYPASRKLAQEIADLLTPFTAQSSYLDLWVDGDLRYRIQPNKAVSKAKTKQKQGAVFSGDLNEPLYGSTYMPRKFKCAVTVPGDNSVDILTHDIGLVAFTKKNGTLKGCNVYVGGGMGRTHNNEQTYARTADLLGYVAGEHILEFVQSVLALQRDYGDRKTRRHARMKYLLHEMGFQWFKNELTTKYFQQEIKPPVPETKKKLKDYLGWNRQSKGIWFVGIPLLSGRLKGNLKKGLRKLVETYQLEIRLTPNQDILLCNIGDIQKSSVKRGLEVLGIEYPEKVKRLEKHALACPALPLCGLAVTEAERALPGVLNRVEALLKEMDINKSILIRMTGCPNGCARPYMAELALVGSGVGDYQLWLGGTPDLERLAKPYLQRMPITELESTLRPLLKSWKNTGASISLGEHVRNLGDQAISSLLTGGVHEP